MSTPESKRRDLENAFLSLYEFCCTEMQWDFFRADRLLTGEEQSMTLLNAHKLRTYLEDLKHIPVVAEVLKK